MVNEKQPFALRYGNQFAHFWLKSQRKQGKKICKTTTVQFWHCLASFYCYCLRATEAVEEKKQLQRSVVNSGVPLLKARTFYRTQRQFLLNECISHPQPQMVALELYNVHIVLLQMCRLVLLPKLPSQKPQRPTWGDEYPFDQCYRTRPRVGGRNCYCGYIQSALN